MKNSIFFFVLALVSFSFLACEKDNLQPALGVNTDLDQKDIQDVLAEAEVNAGDNFYDQSDLQDILADEKAVSDLGIAAQRSIVPRDQDGPPEGISTDDLTISMFDCNGSSIRPGGDFKLVVHDPNDADINKYNSREYQTFWIYSNGRNVTGFRGNVTGCLCGGKIKVTVYEIATGSHATIERELSGSCGFTERLPETEAPRERI